MQEGGWVRVDELLAACAAHGVPISRQELTEVVAGSDKQRFAFDANGTRIRAQQGHSVEVDLQLLPTAPPPVLYHGTAPAALPAIRREGLQKISATTSTFHPTKKRRAAWEPGAASPSS